MKKRNSSSREEKNLRFRKTSCPLALSYYSIVVCVQLRTFDVNIPLTLGWWILSKGYIISPRGAYYSRTRFRYCTVLPLQECRTVTMMHQQCVWWCDLYKSHIHHHPLPLHSIMVMQMYVQQDIYDLLLNIILLLLWICYYSGPFFLCITCMLVLTGMYWFHMCT